MQLRNRPLFMWYRTLLFLILNFLALGLGSMLMGEGASSDWYQNLEKAPWTPPGWVFGAAWSLIMVCFAFYMAYAWKLVDNRAALISLYAVQWVLNVSWNLFFFRLQLVLPGLIIIVALTLLVAYFLFAYRASMKARMLWVLPYFVWLLLATSLNAYIYFNN